MHTYKKTASDIEFVDSLKTKRQERLYLSLFVAKSRNNFLFCVWHTEMSGLFEDASTHP